MQKKPEIVLSRETEFVYTDRISALIAEALYPHVEGEPRMIGRLEKTEKPSRWRRRREGIEALVWRNINDDDRAVLDEIWKGLAKLKLPLTQPITDAAWQPYSEALEQNGKDLDFYLIPEFDPKTSRVAFLRDRAKIAHGKQLHTAISRGDIIQRHPTNNIPTTEYLESGKVAVVDLTRYVEQFRIDVRSDAVSSGRPTSNTRIQKKKLGRKSRRTTEFNQTVMEAANAFDARSAGVLRSPRAISEHVEFVSHVQKAGFNWFGENRQERINPKPDAKAYAKDYGIEQRYIKSLIKQARKKA
jgi:hypothetical protein